MSNTVKVILGVVAGAILLALIVVGLAAYWWSQNSQRVLEGGRRAYEDGKAFGAGTDNRGCLTEAISRHKANTGFAESIKTNLFLRSCLKSSRPTPGFCDGVPKASEIMKTVAWQREQCTREGLSSDSYCGQLFSQVQQHCEQDMQPQN